MLCYSRFFALFMFLSSVSCNSSVSNTVPLGLAKEAAEGENPGGSSPEVLNYKVGGTLSGLKGTIVLQNNSGDDIELTADGTFQFATSIIDGASYSVSVSKQPDFQTCEITGSSGIVSTKDVTDVVVVVCVTHAYNVGGTISGLSGTVVLQNNSGDDLEITADGTFQFNSSIDDRSTYVVSVKTQPLHQTCTVMMSSGTISSQNASDVQVACSTNSYTVSFSVTGLSGALVLQLNGGSDKSVTSNLVYSFATKVADGSTYTVSVLTQPTGKVCTVTNGTGVMSGENVVDVAVSCVSATYTISGTVTGLVGSIVLARGSDSVPVSADGSFSLPNSVAYGSSYTVTVSTQPAGNYWCGVLDGSGTATADVSNVEIHCNPDKTISYTSNSHNGNLGGVSGADAICNSTLSGSKALVSDSRDRVACGNANCASGLTGRVDWVLKQFTRYKRPDSTVVAYTDKNSLFVAPLEDTIASSSDSAVRAWTGMSSGWMPYSNSCDHWTSSSGNPNQAIASQMGKWNGSSYNASSGYICNGSNRLICVEQ